MNTRVDFDILAIQGSYADRFAGAIAAASGARMSDYSEGEEDLSYILSITDNVAVINIKGMLTKADSSWLRYYGLLSYAEIQRAIFQAVDKGVASILFDFSTPGGDVTGMMDIVELMSNIPVPTVGHASGNCCSAGYFCAMQLNHLYSSLLSEVGSIGVLVKTYDVSKMNEQYGIKVERFRSGSLKAVGDPDFSLTKEEKDYVSNQVAYMANVFFDAVSDARGLPRTALDKLGVTSGRTFFGEDAVRIGLVDKVQSFEKSMLKAYELAANYLDKKQAVRLF